MPLRKEAPTPRTAAVTARLDPTRSHASPSNLGPLIPFKPGQTSLRKQAILTEDEYTSALSSVIKRDFFPDLDRVTAENEYLEAVEDSDPVRVRRALRRLMAVDGRSEGQEARKQRPQQTPRSARAGGSERGEWDDTPIATGSSMIFNPTFTPALSTPGLDVEEEEEDDAAEPPSGITPNLDLSLADFQARYTSEDNASFSQLLDRGNQERKRKHAHLFARERASVDQRRRILATEQLEAEKGKQLAIEANPDHPKLLQQASPTLLIEESSAGDKGKQPSSEEAGDEGKQPSTEKAREKDPLDDLIFVPEPRSDHRTPATGLNRWKYTARNALMFPPDANTTYLHARAGPSNDSTAQTNFSALRMSDHPTGGEVEGSDAGWSPSSSRVDAAIARGRAGSLSSSVEETPKVNGYGFVTPYSTPQHSEEEVQMRVYNAIKAQRSATPVGGGSGGFELPRYDKREEVAQKLMSKSSGGVATPYGKAKYGGLAGLRARGFASPKQTLSPAAKMLLERSTRGVTPAGRGLASPVPRRVDGGEARRVGDRGWTPTPQHAQGRR